MDGWTHACVHRSMPSFLLPRKPSISPRFVCPCARTHVRACVHACVCACVLVRAYVGAWVRGCVPVCARVLQYACVCVVVWVHVWLDTFPHFHAQICLHVCSQARAHVHAQAHEALAPHCRIFAPALATLEATPYFLFVRQCISCAECLYFCKALLCTPLCNAHVYAYAHTHV